LLTTLPVIDGRIHWNTGEKRTGWMAVDDLAAVSALVLAEGPDKHASKQYWLSTEIMNGVEAAEAITQGLGQPIRCVVMTPDDLLAQLASGTVSMPPVLEANYAASALEWLRQTYDGRMHYSAVTTTTVRDLTGRPPLTLRAWGERYRDLVLKASKRPA
jgi:NAD(P)H dehydrogenase (quinone)